MENTLIIIGTCIGVVGLFILLEYLKYRKIDVKGILTKLEGFLKGAENYTESLEELATGKIKKALSFTELLEKAGTTAVGYAEQLLLSGQIENDLDGSKRKEKALKYIYALLEKEGIKVDDNVETITSGIVENTVLSDKTIEEINKTIDEKISAISKEKDLLQQRVNDLTSKNIALQNKIDAIQATAKTIETTVTPETPAASTETTKIN